MVSAWERPLRGRGNLSLRKKCPARRGAFLLVMAALCNLGQVDPQHGRITLQEYSAIWLAGRPALRPRTLELYNDLLEHRILPELGHVELSRIAPSAVRSWHARLAAHAPSTAAKAYRLLRTILNTALADERISRNPCRVEGAGVERLAERPTASVAEVEALADAMPDRLAVLVLLAAWCGLRRGELLALRRSDVDLLHATIRVERTSHQLKDGRLIVGPPKSQAGVRTIAVPPHLAPTLALHLEHFVGPDSGSLVFTGIKGGPLRVHVLQQLWSRARKAVGREDLHLHDLRHSGNTWASATGASTRELMARMGHASPRAALIYQHATADRDRAIAAALSSLAEHASVTPLHRDVSQPANGI